MRTDMNKGSALLIGLIIAVLLLGMGIAFLTMVTSKGEVSQASLSQHTTYQIAQAGLDMARHALLVGHANGWDDELVTSNNNWQTYNPQDLPIQGVGTDPGVFQWARNIAYYQGTYRARIIDNDDGDGNPLVDKDDIITIRVNSLLSSGEESILMALVRYKPPVYEPDCAIVTGGSLQLGGNSSISGTQGTIYATGDVDIGGSASVEQDVYTPGTITGEDNVGGTCYPGAESPEVPEINPSDYKDLADYILEPDGEVRTITGTLIGTADGTIAVVGWKYIIATQTWENLGTPVDGTFYVEDGNIDIAGNVGSEADPWQVTLLVMGITPGNGEVNIRGTGNTVMVPDEDSVSILAWGDIDVSGTFDVRGGLVGTHENIAISGNASIAGSVVAEASTLGTAGLSVEGLGNCDIAYNGGMTTFLEQGDPAVIILGIKREK